MKITRVEIHNYRNLDGVIAVLADDCNFIVGENNLGKSSFLLLLNSVFSVRSFNYEDFKDPTQPIEIGFRLYLAPVEIGHFQDLFDNDDFSSINITARQIDSEENIEFHHTESDTFISPHNIKSLNYIHYDSLRNPINEINFERRGGVGRFLRSIISKYLQSSEGDEAVYLDDTKLDGVLNSINDKITKIKSFKDFGILASPESDIESLLSKVVTLKDGQGNSLTKAGYGVQFLILVTLSILEKLQFIQLQRGERGIFYNEEAGTKSISLVLGLDEPEIHLHPYMQRSLIKYLNSIVNNTNPDFKALIKDLFDIDEFIGQVLVVTHSPNIILNDYKQIIRFYSDNSITKVVSGSNINLNAQLHKHLFLHFPFIKEAFFSRCVILVEGDSEFSSFPYFGKTMGLEFDDLGICVIQARGDGISQLIDLTSKFGIPSVGITDKDDGLRALEVETHFQTDERDFEAEIISLIDAGKEARVRSILIEYDSLGIERTFEKDALNKRAHKKHGIGQVPFENPLKLSEIPENDIVNLKAFYLTWFSVNKSYPLGVVIGNNLDSEEIPTIYKTVITKANTLIQNAN